MKPRDWCLVEVPDSAATARLLLHDWAEVRPEQKAYLTQTIALRLRKLEAKPHEVLHRKEIRAYLEGFVSESPALVFPAIARTSKGLSATEILNESD